MAIKLFYWRKILYLWFILQNNKVKNNTQTQNTEKTIKFLQIPTLF